MLPESDSDESEEGGRLVGVNLSVCSSMVCSDSLSESLALALEITIHVDSIINLHVAVVPYLILFCKIE